MYLILKVENLISCLLLSRSLEHKKLMLASEGGLEHKKSIINWLIIKFFNSRKVNCTHWH